MCTRIGEAPCIFFQASIAMTISPLKVRGKRVTKAMKSTSNCPMG